MITPAELEQAMAKAVNGTDEAALWIVVKELVAKGTAVSLVGALVLTLNYIEVNRESLAVSYCTQILDRLEDLISA